MKTLLHLTLATVLTLPLAAADAYLPVKSPAPSSATARKTLLANFPRDARQVAYRWDPGDPRPEAERLRALAAFVYESYDSSAWIPQSFISVNRVLLGSSTAVDTILRDQLGLVLWPQNKSAPVFGMAPNPARDQSLSWTLNCLACHMAEIDGVAYLGAGAKTLDELWLGRAAQKVTELTHHTAARTASPEQATARRAHDILRQHHHEVFEPLTRGRSTAFPASHVEMHMRAQGGTPPDFAKVGRGDVKSPPLWHAAAKAPFQRWYCDGSFTGTFPLMASSMELALDQTFDKLAASVVPQIQADFRNVIQFLRPPRYPHAIDARAAARGKQLFESEQIGCASCHGTYDGQGNVQWTGLHTDVGTDPARLQLVNADFVTAFQASPLAQVGKLAPSRGYAATPLTGVWANFPYLHNGSVPTLYHLLGPASARPRLFSVQAARHFDRVKVGQALRDPSAAAAPEDEAELLRRHGNDRDWFNADRTGCDNGGHDFWSRIKTEENRLDLIEYLKTL